MEIKSETSREEGTILSSPVPGLQLAFRAPDCSWMTFTYGSTVTVHRN